jgi:hypothetical protein
LSISRQKKEWKVEQREMNPEAQNEIHSLSKNVKLPANRAGLPGKDGSTSSP